MSKISLNVKSVSTLFATSCSTNSPQAYIWEGLLSEGFLRLRFGGLIFERTYFGGAYYRNFTVTVLILWHELLERQVHFL